MAAPARRIAKLSLVFIAAALAMTGCVAAEEAGPALGDAKRPVARAAAEAATNLSNSGEGLAQIGSRTLDICAVDPLGSISNPSAPRIYSCDIYRVTLLTFTSAPHASAAALLIDENFVARSCTVLAPLVTPAAQPALDALDAERKAPPVRGWYECNGEKVTATVGRADNATMRTKAQTPPSPLSGTVVTEEPPIGVRYLRVNNARAP